MCSVKLAQQQIDDYRPKVNNLVITAQEVVSLCRDRDSTRISRIADDVVAAYDALKQTMREKLVQLDVVMKHVVTDVSIWRTVAAIS